MKENTASVNSQAGQQPIANTPALSNRSKDITLQDQNGAFNRLLKFAAFPIAAIAGYVTTFMEVRGHASQDAIKDGSLTDIVAEKDKLIEPLITARKNNEIPLKEFLQKEHEIRTKYRLAADARMEHMGHGGFLKRFDYIRRSARAKAIIDGTTAAGITLGVLLTVADSQMLTNLTARDKEKTPER